MPLHLPGKPRRSFLAMRFPAGERNEQDVMNKNKIITDDFSSEESKHLYETEYAENEASRIAYKQGYQCGDCSFFAPFNKDYGLCCFKPRLCSRRRSEAQKTSVRREVGAILCRRHIHKYVEKQNREIPTSRDSKDFQAAVDVYCTIWV
jgi:hypothetical protein